MKMYSLYDCKSLQFMHPFGQHNERTAIRVVLMDMRKTDTIIGQNPEDFTLYEVGEFDEDKGTFVSYDAPLVVMKGDQIWHVMSTA